MCPQDVQPKLRVWEKDILTFWILFNAIASMAMSGVACQLAICFSHIQFSFPRRVPPNPPQRLIRKSRRAYDKLMAQTVYLDLVEIISKMTLFSWHNGKDNEDILLSSLFVPRVALSNAQLLRSARSSRERARQTRKLQLTVRWLRCLCLKGRKCQLLRICSGRTGSGTQRGEIQRELHTQWSSGTHQTLKQRKT